ncbi:hypothetical protein FRB96_006808 [Tulasnella sp. 330]|nr:hypothetical protein FRB96_006808 [Tulasnella sp. 330]
MAPFGLSRPSWTKKKSKSGSGDVYLAEDPYGETHAYTLSGGDHSQSQYMQTTTQVPTKMNKWKTVLKRKPAPQVVETLTPLRDPRFEEHSDDYYNHQGTLPPVPTNESPAHSYVQTVRHDQSVRRVDSRVDSGSSGSSRSSSHRRAHSEHRGVQRHETGRSGAVTILPHDSASNIHVYNEQQYQQPQVHHGHGGPLHGIVEEQSDISYNEPHVHRPISPVITPIGHASPGQPMVIGPAGSVQRHGSGGSYSVQHDIGRGLHLHHSDKHNGRGMMPFQVTDAHGNKQDIQEVMLDGSGIQEIPMPSHGNVIFIVEEGVTLDVKDPETGEYVPLEQYYANLAARRPPQQDQFVVVNGDASNVVVEDVNGNVLHRGSKVKDEFMSQRSRSHSERSEERAYDRSQRSGSVRSGSNHHVTVGSGKTNHIKVTNPNPNPEIRVYHQQLASPSGLKQGMDHWVIDVPSERQMQTPAVHVYSPQGSMRPPTQMSSMPPSAVQLQSTGGSMLSRASSMNASQMAPSVNSHIPQGSMRSHMSRASSMNGPNISRSVSVASGQYSARSGVPAASIRSHEAPTVEIVAEPGSNVIVTTGHEGEARLEHGMGSPVTVHVTGTPRSHQIDVASVRSFQPSVRSMQPSMRSMARSTATGEVVEAPLDEVRGMTPAQSIRMDPSPRSILKGRATPAKSMKSIRSLSKKTPGNEPSILGSRPPSQQSPVDDGASIHNALLMNPQPVEIMAMPVPHVEMAPIQSPEKLHMMGEGGMESFKLPEAPSPGGNSVYMPPASPLGKPGSFRSSKSVRSNRSNLRRVGFESGEQPEPEALVVERSPSVRSTRNASAEQLLSLVVPSAEPGSGPVVEEPMMVAQSPATRSVRSARAPSIRAPSYRENVLSAVDEGGESTLGFTGMPSPQLQGEVNLASPMKSPMQFSRPSSPYAHHETNQAFALDPAEPVAPGGFAFDQWGAGSPGQKAPSIRSHQSHQSHQSHHSHNNQEQQVDGFGMMASPGQRAPSLMSRHSNNNHEQGDGWGVGSKAPSIRSHNSYNNNNNNEQFEEGGFGLGSPPKSRTPSVRASSIRSNKVLSPMAADVMREEAIGEEPGEEPTQMILEEPTGDGEPKEIGESSNLLGDGTAEPTIASADDWGMPVKKGKKGKKGKK